MNWIFGSPTYRNDLSVDMFVDDVKVKLFYLYGLLLEKSHRIVHLIVVCIKHECDKCRIHVKSCMSEVLPTTSDLINGSDHHYILMGRIATWNFNTVQINQMMMMMMIIIIMTMQQSLTLDV